MTKRSERQIDTEIGSELIEFALVFPMLPFVCLGIVDFDFLFQRYEVVTNASREAARVAALPQMFKAESPHTFRRVGCPLPWGTQPWR